MKQRVETFRIYEGKVSEIINKAIEEEAHKGWIVKQIVPIATFRGLTYEILLFLESQDDEVK